VFYSTLVFKIPYSNVKDGQKKVDRGHSEAIKQPYVSTEHWKTNAAMHTS